jgi:hypothetical protein
LPTSPESLAHSIDALTQTVNQLRSELVRKDVWIEARRADQDKLKDLEGDVAAIDQRTKSRDRLLVVMLVLPIINSLILLYVTQVIFS